SYSTGSGCGHLSDAINFCNPSAGIFIHCFRSGRNWPPVRTLKSLDNRPLQHKNTRNSSRGAFRLAPNANMSTSPTSPTAKQPSETTNMQKVCRHPRVRVVAREEDAEFVECLECGDVFDSSEFKDMAIEDNIQPEDA